MCAELSPEAYACFWVVFIQYYNNPTNSTEGGEGDDPQIENDQTRWRHGESRAPHRIKSTVRM